jgi:molecular chaperone HtpG
LKEKVAPIQTDKDNKVVFLYTPDAEEQFSMVKKAKERGYEVLVLNSPLASHWISKMEQTFEKVTFTRVDSDSLDNLIKKSEEIPSKLSKDEEEKVKGVFEGVVNKDKFTVQIQSMSSDEAHNCYTTRIHT